MNETEQTSDVTEKTPYTRVHIGVAARLRAVLIFLYFSADGFKRFLSKCIHGFQTWFQNTFHFIYNRRTRRMAILTACMMIALTTALINTQIGYAVTLDGENLGSARSKTELMEVMNLVEQEASEILGYEYSLDDHISVKTELYSATQNSQALVNAILNRIDGITRLYVIKVDGEIVGAVSDYSTINRILDEMVNRFSTSDTISAKFVQSVTIEYGFVSEEISQDLDDIEKLLDPKNTESKYSLKIERIDYTQTTEEIAFQSEYYDDETLYEGDVCVVQNGVNGETSITNRSVCINNEVTSKTIVNTYVSVAPVTELVACGTALRPRTASYGTYIWPAAGTVTSYYGYRSVSVGSSDHKGIDIASSYGEIICAADGGEVIFAGWYSGYGNMVQIRHDNGDMTYYGHCCSLLVTEGERVYQGQEIALMGASGVASGVHLHFEIRVNGEPVDPVNYLG